jgi:anti-sigma factor RsiW
MSNDPTYNRWRELSWRRKLSDAEQAELQAWLAAHPEARAEWEEDAALEAALKRLPQAPVPSNFTARVLQAAERETAAERRRPEGRTWRWARWLPRAAFAASMLAAGLLSYLLVQRAERQRLAESVAVVADVSSLPSPEVLQDFDVIRVSNPTVTPDEELLAVLK